MATKVIALVAVYALALQVAWHRGRYGKDTLGVGVAKVVLYVAVPLIAVMFTLFEVW